MKAIGFSLVAMVALAGCVSPYGKEVSVAPVSLSAKQQAEAKAAVTYSLIDPDSATFRNISGKRRTFDSGTVFTTVCGEVNAKNRMGGYTGYSWFHGDFDGAGKFTLRNVDGVNEFMSHYSCRG